MAFNNHHVLEEPPCPWPGRVETRAISGGTGFRRPAQASVEGRRCQKIVSVKGEQRTAWDAPGAWARAPLLCSCPLGRKHPHYRGQFQAAEPAANADRAHP